MTSRPLIVAHRTCPSHAPENTLAGVRVAVAAGADVVEVDVRRSADGVAVLVHDPHLRRIGRRWRRVSGLTARQLADVAVLGSTETIPTLADALDLLVTLGPVGVALDVKDRHAVGAVLDALDASPFAGMVLGWSRHRQVVQELAAAGHPRIEVALLRGSRRPGRVASLLADAVAWGATAVSVDERIVDRDLIRSAASRRLGVYTMVNAASAAAIADLFALGVAGVITDWPELAPARR